MKEVFALIKETIQDFSEDRCARMAAALSYYTVFSLPALLILVLSIVGFFVDPGAAQGRFMDQLAGLIGPRGGEAMRTMIEQANQPRGGIMAVVGIIALILGATGAFAQLQDALNTAWEVKPDPAAGGVKQFVAKRFLSFGMILVIAFMLLVSFVASAAIAAFGDLLDRYLGSAGEFIGQVTQIVLGLLVAWALFALMFKVLPDARIKWRDVAVGAFVTAVLFTVGRFLIGLYLGKSASADAFGAAAALAIVFVWIYYAANILFLGAEFTQVWVRHQGRRLEPEPGAMKVPATRPADALARRTQTPL
ncbi:MAG TPA: YihY/virulence factor BrkB family protein [Burkholderiales bacterium]|nr:YihY/virulence factor BrkB family protein [Burkholderiales bacterium]